MDKVVDKIEIGVLSVAIYERGGYRKNSPEYKMYFVMLESRLSRIFLGQWDEKEKATERMTYITELCLEGWITTQYSEAARA